MSEFKIPGDRFVSQWNGSPANPGTALAPYAHPSSAPSSTTNIVVVSTGIYKGGWSGSRKIFGDGKVLIEGTGSESITLVASSPLSRNIHLKNLNSILNGNGIDLIYENINTVSITSFNNGSLRGIFLGDMTLSMFGSHPFIDGNIVYTDNSNNFLRQGSYGYVSKSSKITRTSVADWGFINSMVNGIINRNGIDYELKRLVNGSPRLDANPLISDFILDYPNVYVNGNFAGDPKFIDVLNRIVELDSDLLKRSNANGFIGGVRPGKSISVNSSDSDVTITTTNINTSNPTNWVIQSPESSGTIKIVWKLSDNISEIERLLLDALLSFDGSVAGGTVGNNNVPDIFPTAYIPLSQVGLKPNRLTYALRTSQSISKPVITAEWDNDNVTLGTTVGAFYIQEWNTKPTIVTALGVRYGNGNPESIGGVSNGINARWAEAEIRLTNNRSF